MTVDRLIVTIQDTFIVTSFVIIKCTTSDPLGSRGRHFGRRIANARRGSTGLFNDNDSVKTDNAIFDDGYETIVEISFFSPESARIVTDKVNRRQPMKIYCFPFICHSAEFPAFVSNNSKWHRQ